MSWSIKRNGSPTAVKAYVQTQTFHNDTAEDKHFEWAKAIICDMIDRMASLPFVSVVADGSEGSNWENSCKISVRPDQRKPKA